MYASVRAFPIAAHLRIQRREVDASITISVGEPWFAAPNAAQHNFRLSSKHPDLVVKTPGGKVPNWGGNPHSQPGGRARASLRPKSERRATAKMSDCLFCKIRDGQIPAKSVYSDDQVF